MRILFLFLISILLSTGCKPFVGAYYDEDNNLSTIINSDGTGYYVFRDTVFEFTYWENEDNLRIQFRDSIPSNFANDPLFSNSPEQNEFPIMLSQYLELDRKMRENILFAAVYNRKRGKYVMMLLGYKKE